MSMPMRDIIISIVMLVIGAWFMFLASELPDRNIQNVPGPAFFPGIMAFVIIALSAALLVKGLRALPSFSLTLDIPRKAVYVVVLFIVLLAVLPHTGFLIAAIPFFAALMWLCDDRKPLLVLFSSILIPVFLYYLFRHAFTILLPTAPWM